MQPTQTGIAVALALAVITALLVFPGLSPFRQQETAQDTTIQIATTTTMATADTDTLLVTDEVVGTGAVAQAGDTVTVNYVGSLTNGTVFDASANHGSTGFTFNLGAGEVIRGWDLGVEGMKVGGKRKLVIPSDLAYGDRAIGNVIPANSTLIFEVELLKVEKATR